MIKLNHVHKFYHKNKSNEIHVLDDINLNLGDVGFVAILGKSGSGKTTLLNSLCGLDKIHSGSIIVEDTQLRHYQDRTWSDLRNQYFGYIFQNYNLFGDKTVFQNVAFSLEMLGIKDKELIRERVIQSLSLVKMEKYKNRLAKNLSGGEQQRVAIARAIVKDAKFIIADEPTGNLDRKNTIIIMNILKEIAKTRLVVMVTHEKPLASVYANRIIHISDGKIIDDIDNNVTGELAYEDERMLNLSEFTHRHIENSLIKLDLYHKEEVPNLSLKLIIKGKNIYLQPSNDQFSYEILASDSYHQVKDESLDQATLMPIADFTGFPPLERPKKFFQINLWKYFTKGLTTVLDISRFKKVLLFGFVFASFILTVTFGLYNNMINVDESMFMTQNRDLISLTIEGTKEEKFNKFKEYLSRPDVYGFSPTPSQSGSVIISQEDFFQTYNPFIPDEASLFGTVIDYQSVKNYRSNWPIPRVGEVVLDRMVVDYLLKDRYNNQLTSDKMILGQMVSFGGITCSIKGIVDGNNLAIYTSKTDAMNYRLTMSDKIFDINEVTTSYNQPLANGEVLVATSNMGEKTIGNKITIATKTLTIVGTFEKPVGYVPSEIEREGYVISEETYLELAFNRLNSDFSSKSWFYLLSDTPEKTSKAIDESGFYAQSVYEKQLEDYQQQIKQVTRVLFILVGVMLIAPLLMLFFVMRSNMIGRIREIGIYRALGLRKINIYKMHLGEILAITSLFSFSGYLLAILMMVQINQKLIISMFRIDLIVILGSFLAIALINGLVGLLPVFRLLRRTPQEILTKYDI